MRNIATCNECGAETAAAAQFVLADFKDAYAAYESMGQPSDEDGPAFEFVTDAAAANVAVIAFDAPDAACARVAHLAAGTQIYGIRIDADMFPSQAGSELELACKQHELAYMGALLVSKEPQGVAKLAGKPRMGWRRRKLSEATDRLIACVRAGISVQEAAEAFGASKKQRLHAKRNLIIV